MIKFLSCQNGTIRVCPAQPGQHVQRTRMQYTFLNNNTPHSEQRRTVLIRQTVHAQTRVSSQARHIDPAISRLWVDISRFRLANITTVYLSRHNTLNQRWFNVVPAS